MTIVSSFAEYDIVFKPNNIIKKVYIELTNDCNLACEMCYRNSWHGTIGEMNEQLFNTLVNQIATNIDVEEVILGGLGEPMYHAKFWEFLKLLNDRLPNIPIALTTNGILLTSEIVKKLAQLGVKKVIVSVDGVDQETQTEVRGEKSEIVVNKLLALGEAFRENTEILWWWEFVWQKKNKNQLYNLVDLANKCNVKKIIISHLLPTSPQQVNEVLYEPMLEADLQKSLDKARNLALLHGLEIALPKSEINTERKCRFVNNHSAVVSYQGKVAPCYRFLHGCKEYNQHREKDIMPYDFGQISSENELIDIWNKPQYLKFRYRVINNLFPSCHDCDLFDGCDITVTSEVDCDGGVPSCGHCLWARGFIHCP
ncbi:radical SAM protein [Desulfuribacillus alkaliarsenatis]|uniref:Radical SAM core domain-containing protein n=1 Tax=Desulfuribacillus alkaliarsenatis TaxID=766136 RepID=A0A1E5FZT3_9FIRM|nr:radical SAM protein [Desulfuribacillus alkaliarsenatis]OEF96105.1 hypothetical protein BHF68_10250 [Desulfuribacillus alkaliarsenatis]